MQSNNQCYTPAFKCQLLLLLALKTMYFNVILNMSIFFKKFFFYWKMLVGLEFKADQSNTVWFSADQCSSVPSTAVFSYQWPVHSSLLCRLGFKKKKLWPKNKETMPTGKFNHSGKLVTSPPDIKALLYKEYNERLRTRPDHPNLKSVFLGQRKHV